MLLRYRSLGYCIVICCLVELSSATCVAAQGEHFGAPFFRDPVYDGAADPEIVWNRHAREWWVFYTARRARMEGPLTWAGCAIGVAASKDWKTWRHVGYCKFDGIGGDADSPDTFWAPGIVFDGQKYHMFVVFKKGLPIPFSGEPFIVHYAAEPDELLDGWKKVAVVKTPKNCIDAGLHRVGEQWRMWLKHKGKVHLMTSPDLISWDDRGKLKGIVNEENGIEGPYIFFWQDHYWMITDPHNGIQVYRSEDAEQWEKMGTVLDGPGDRELDLTRGRHPSATVVGDRAFIFYHVEPYRPYPPKYRDLRPAEKTIKQKLCVLQVAEIICENGKLRCDRNPLLPTAEELSAGQKSADMSK